LITEEGVVKLADFGIAFQQTGTRSKAQTLIGTPLFMSPEMLDGERYSAKVTNDGNISCLPYSSNEVT
jgi:serine/threonine protein kinase